MANNKKSKKKLFSKMFVIALALMFALSSVAMGFSVLFGR